MASYIEKFSSTIRKKQTEQILKLLNKQRSTGQIRTVEEFTSRLDTLVRDLSQTNLVPTMKLFKAETYETINSETYNHILDRVEDDLTAAFGEAYNIDQVQKAHRAIIRDVLLKSLKHGVDELDSKITLYEFLQGDKNGFTGSIFSTFRESKNSRTLRAATSQIAALFTDPRSNIATIPTTEDANIDLIGERLTLGFESKDSFNPRIVKQIWDADTTVSTNVIAYPNTKLENMIDGETGTFWVQSVLGSNALGRLTTKLEFELPGTRTINFIEIVPANVFPVRLSKIYYLSTNVIELLAEPNLLITGRTSYIFPTVTTDRIILEFESYTRRQVSYQRTPDKLSWQLYEVPPPAQSVPTPPASAPAPGAAALSEVQLAPSVTTATSAVGSPGNSGVTGPGYGVGPPGTRASTDTGSNPTAPVGTRASTSGPGTNITVAPAGTRAPEPSPVATLPTPPPLPTYRAYAHEIGFDIIKFGKGNYSNKSLYVSNPFLSGDPLQVGLKVIEKRPASEAVTIEPEMTTSTYDTDDDTFFHGSIEYWLIKRDFDRSNKILATNKIPLLPTGVSRVHHERLVLTVRSSSSIFLPDSGYLMFFADTDVSNIKVYRNGYLMNTGEWSDTTTEANRTPNSGNRMRYRIRIKNLLAGDIFTVSYNPVVSSTISIPTTLEEFSSTGISIVDLTGNLSARPVHDQLVLLNKGPTPERIYNTRLYLAIMLRNNASNTALTPAVEEYTVVIGEKNALKFNPKAF